MNSTTFSDAFEEMLRRHEEIMRMPTERRACDVHGEFDSRAVPRGRSDIHWSGCPACAEEEARVIHEERNKREATERQAVLEKMFRRAGVPERFIGKSFGNYLSDTPAKARALKAAQRFADSEERGLSMIMCGRPGTGKTHLACAIASAKVAIQSAVQFMTAVAAVRYVRSTYSKDSELSECEAIDNLCSPDLLILDEVGVQHGTEHEKMILFDVINDRYSNCRSTILLSNLSADDLRTYLGDRIIDRFKEGGFVLNFDWESHRGRK